MSRTTRPWCRLGEYVVTIGYPTPLILGREPKFTEGSISALSGPHGVANLLQISIPIQPGNSGGPVVNDAGELVGVVILTAAVARFLQQTDTLPQNLNWAVKADDARALVDLPAARVPARNRKKVIEQAQLAACQLESTP